MNKHRMPMSAPMIRAIQREIDQPGTGKTMTRRLVKPQPWRDEFGKTCVGEIFGPEMYAPIAVDRFGEQVPGPEVFGVYSEDGDWAAKSPYGKPGDLLAFTETFALVQPTKDGILEYEEARLATLYDQQVEIWYRADGSLGLLSTLWDDGPRWTGSMLMPYPASRYTGLITDVRVERLCSITKEDALAEGVIPQEYTTARGMFGSLWQSIHGPGSWEENPWVWVYTFRPIAANVLDVEREPEKYGVST